MTKKRGKKAKQSNPISFVKIIGRLVWSTIKFFFKSIWWFSGLIVKIYDFIARKVIRTPNEIDSKKQSKQIKKDDPKNESLKLIHSFQGNLDDWVKKISSSDSTIGIILGARGTGKSAFGMRFLENTNAKTKKKCYAIGFKEEETPSWIEVVDGTDKIHNNAFVLIDEGGVLFSSRNSMTTANKMLSELILIARHKNLSILFISQNSSNLDINIIRQADYLVLKPSSLLQRDFERKKIKQVYDEVEKQFNEYKNERGLTYIYSDSFRGFVSNKLPSFWSEKLSKSFSG